MTCGDYVLVTAARNEQAVIEGTIRSVAAQTVRPQQWVIVSDNSSDRTDDIVRALAREYPFITLVRRSHDANIRSFGSKVHAFRLGYAKLCGQRYGFLGNLDADVTFASDYFEKVLERFGANPRLGLAGGLIHELIGSKFISQRIIQNSVAGAVQMFRRECYEQIGGYIPLRYGGIDSAVEIVARMCGWEVQTFRDLEVRHHRRVASGGGTLLPREWRHGLRHYSLGYHPLFELVRNIYKIPERPYAVGAVVMTLGYLWALATGNPRELPVEAVRFLQKEQKKRLLLMVLKSWPWPAGKNSPVASR